MSNELVMSVTDELIAELEEWFDNEARDCKGGEPVLGITADHLRAVFAERAELKRDAERYRWLRDNYHGFEHYRSMNHRPNAFRDEIDAAMQL